MSEHSYWNETRKKFLKVDLDQFKISEPVLSVPIYNFFQFENDYGQDIVQLLENFSDEQKSQFKNAMKEPFLGHTKESYEQARKYLAIDNELVEVSPWTLKSMHHILSYMIHTKENINNFEQIVEFGPGIGETCRIINDLGYKNSYYLYDLPEVLRVSSFYNKKYENVIPVTHYTEIPNNKRTLFIATWSISETPFEYRDEVFHYFKDSEFLIIYQSLGFEYDNRSYFDHTFSEIVGRKTLSVEIPWLRHIADGNYYLFIKREA